MSQHELERRYERVASIADLRAALEDGIAELRDDPELRGQVGLTADDVDQLEVEVTEDRSGLTGVEVVVAIGVSAAGRVVGEVLITVWKRVLWPKIRDLVGTEQ